MFRLAWLLLGFTVAIFPATALLFESPCDSFETWDVLDLTGDGREALVQDLSCPPGYGPEVLHTQGDVTLLMPKGIEFAEGTIVALYRENEPRDFDADGVILFWADYPMDISQAHNTKERRAHAWLEQDNDYGFQIKRMRPDGKDASLVERSGYGIVTDPWNKTNWIWQKVRIEGDVVRAKYWPAECAEPEEWAIDATYDAPKGKRFGIKINSGDIHVAYFAADAHDIPIPAPKAFLQFSMPRATQTSRLPFTLFLNAPEAVSEVFRVTLTAAGKPLAHGEFQAEVSQGHGELPFMLSTGDAADFVGPVIALDTDVPTGACRVAISTASGAYTAERTFEVMPVAEFQKRLDAIGSAVAQLEGCLADLEFHPKAAALRVIHAAALAHHASALEWFRNGDVEAAEASLRFAVEALNEFEGHKGVWFWEGGSPLSYPTEFNQHQGVGDADRVQDVYSMDYLIHFGVPALEAQSAVMGGSYDVAVPWFVEGASPDRDFRFEVHLVSPYGERVVAQTDAAPGVPSSQWQSGETYMQHMTLDVSPEAVTEHPGEPSVLDESHRLLVALVDPETGARLLLGNPAGPQNDRVGTGFLLADLYVSSFPVEIRGFEPDDGAVLSLRTEHVVLRAVGDEPLDVNLLFTASTETGRIVFQDARTAALSPDTDIAMPFDWTPDTAGPLTLRLQVIEDGLMRTEAKAEVDVTPPPGYDLRVVKSNHVEERGGGYVTPITIHTGNMGALSARVMTAPIPATATTGPVTGLDALPAREVGARSGEGPVLSIDVEPWFGYYNVFVDCGAFRFDKRLVATVVETSGMDLLVNGEPFIVKGVNVHGMDGRSPERTAAMMRVMRDLGFNTWRGDYPAPWQVELAYQLNTAYTVLAPFSVSGTSEIFARQDGPHLATPREIARLFVERYRDSAGVLLWNSCNEIGGETVDFLNTLYPVFKAYDPYQRPVHYANLYGQDFHQGQDAIGVNYYFAGGQGASDRQPLIQRSIDIARAAGMPIMYNEFNSYAGAIHSTGVDAMYNMFDWGVGAGMCGGFQYMKGDSTSHPGVFDGGFKTHKIYDDAIRRVMADADVALVAVGPDALTLRVTNRRRCTLRKMKLTLTASGTPLDAPPLADIPPEASVDVSVALPESVPGRARSIEGVLEFVTHYGFQCRVPFRLLAAL